MPPLTVLITGSSSGLGLALTRLFLSNHHIVIATSRNPQRTSSLVSEIASHPSGNGTWLALDVTAPQAAINDVFEEAERFSKEKGGGGVDVLVNNAGFSVLGAVETLDEQGGRGQMDVNFWGVLKTTKAVLPSMRKRKTGMIVNVSSIAGLDSGPICGVYAASKFAVEALSDALAVEVADFGVKVVVVNPGAFRTNFLTEGEAMMMADVPVGYERTVVGVSTDKFRDMAGKQRGNVEKGVRVIYEAVVGAKEMEGCWKEGMVRRVVIGGDAYERGLNALGNRLDSVKAMKDWAYKTDHDKV